MNEVSELNEEEQRKFPTSLKVLLILSSIYIALSLMGSIQVVLDGPLTEVQIEEQTAEVYGGLAELESEGLGLQISEMAETMIDSTIYLNNEAFYLHNILRIIESLVGAIAIVLMFQLRKIGFHVYIIYSFLPVITMYISTPQELILTISVVTLILFGGFFSFLYGLNLKYMR